LLLERLTVSAVLPSVTFGGSAPNPLPEIVICVPWVFSATFRITGGFTCATLIKQLASTTQNKSSVLRAILFLHHNVARKLRWPGFLVQTE
jgi:hypothetical protein